MGHDKFAGTLGFSVSFPEEKDKIGFVWRCLCGLVLFAGLFVCVWSVLGLAGLGISPLLISSAGCAYCILSCGLKGRWRLVYIAAAILPLTLVIAAGNLLLEGWNVTANRMFLTMESYIGRIMPRYEVTETLSQPLCATLFLLMPSAALGLLCGQASAGGGLRRFLQVVVMILIWAAALAFSAPLPLAAAAALAAAIAASSGLRLSAKNRIPGGKRFSPWFLALVVAISLLASIPALMAQGESDPSDARLAAARAVRSMRYDRNGRALPEGDFHSLSDFAAINAAEFFEPGADSYYFRGFVGEAYSGNAWTGLSAGRRSEYATLFAWLHAKGFYGQNQYSILREVLGYQEESFEIPVLNTGVSAGYIYAPYEYSGNDVDSFQIGGQNIQAPGLRGETEYTLSVSAGSALDDERLFSALAEAYRNGDTSAEHYLTAENAYREFVYENYLDMPEEAREAIRRFLGGLVLPDSGVSFADAKMVVNAYLITLGYAETPEAAYDSGDFLTYFLEESKEGGSVHFATAAVMMFRYLGVPSRYVEGFRYTGAEMEAAIVGGGINITGENARAWAEIYRDGVGFVPFALVPPDISPPDRSPLETESSVMPLDEDVQETPRDWLNLIILVLRIFVLLLLLLVLMLVTRRILKRRRIRRILSVSDNAEAVSRAVSYLIRVFPHAGIPYERGSLYALRPEVERCFDEDMGGKFDCVIGVQQAALFSGRRIDDADRIQVSAFLREFIDDVKKRANLLARLRLAWIVCVLDV